MQKSGSYENVGATSALLEDRAQTTLLHAGKLLDVHEHHFEPTAAPSSITTPTVNTATPTTTLPQDAEYEEVERCVQTN